MAPEIRVSPENEHYCAKCECWVFQHCKSKECRRTTAHVSGLCPGHRA
jgi:hypothetical protein